MAMAGAYAIVPLKSKSIEEFKHRVDVMFTVVFRKKNNDALLYFMSFRRGSMLYPN